MKKTIAALAGLLFITVVGLTSCLKSDDTPQCTGNTLEQDRSIIDSILDHYEVGYSYDPEVGLYSSIINPGEGSTPTIDSIVGFKYIGRLFDGTSLTGGTIVDSATINSSSLYTLNQIQQSGVGIYTGYALPKIQKGGTIRIIAPSSRFLGCSGGQGVNPIPANAQVIYEYTLLDVQQKF